MSIYKKYVSEQYVNEQRLGFTEPSLLTFDCDITDKPLKIIINIKSLK